MLKLLIIDADEKCSNELTNLIASFPRQDLLLSGVATTFRQGIEMNIHLIPDVIICDIYHNGLTFSPQLKEIKKANNQAFIIVISAIERFDIAQELINIGIQGFLNKPFDPLKLKGFFSEAKKRKENWQAIAENYIASCETQSMHQGIMVSVLMQGIFMRRPVEPFFSKVLDTLRLTEKSFLLAAISAEKSSICDRMEEIITLKTSFIIERLYPDLLMILIPSKDPMELSSRQERILEIVQQGFPGHAIENQLRLGFGVASNPGELVVAWTDAMGKLQLLRSSNHAGLHHSIDNEFRFDIEAELIHALVNQDPDSASNCLDELLKPYLIIDKIERSNSYSFISMFNTLNRALHRQQLIDTTQLRDLSDMEDIHSAVYSIELADKVRTRWLRLLESINNTSTPSFLLAKAMDRINESYHQELSLESVAAEIGLPASKLTKLFIDETGKGFSDYLIKVRIEKAKIMLASEFASIKKVSLSCGYHDPNYFSRLFKHRTGISPSNFMADNTLDDRYYQAI